jgi:hypothetical protein
MSKRATVRLGGPLDAGQRLHLTGFRPPGVNSPVTMKVSVDGRALPPVALPRDELGFELALPLPAEAVGRPAIEVSVEEDRTVRAPGDKRELGLGFGTLEIR